MGVHGQLPRSARGVYACVQVRIGVGFCTILDTCIMNERSRTRRGGEVLQGCRSTPGRLQGDPVEEKCRAFPCRWASTRVIRPAAGHGSALRYVRPSRVGFNMAKGGSIEGKLHARRKNNRRPRGCEEAPSRPEQGSLFRATRLRLEPR